MSIASEISRIKNNVAAAYSVCDSKGADMPPQQNSCNLADTIDSIPSGRGDDIDPEFINFVDYDGTLLYACSQTELQEMTALPPLPQSHGLICTGWNRTLLSLKENNLPDTVGAMYSPADGATKLIYEFIDGDPMSVSITLSEVSRTVDWGDGTVVTNSDTTLSHDYQSPGKYTVRITTESQSQLSVSLFSCSGAFRLVEVNLSDNIICPSSGMFYNCTALRKVTIPQGMTRLSESMFYQCFTLRHVSIPLGVTIISNSLLRYCFSLQSVSLPDGLNDILDFSFTGCYALRSITFPPTVGRFGPSAFSNCLSLCQLVFPSSVYYFFPGYVFAYDTGLRIVDLSALTTVPRLSSTDAFQSVNAVFYVRNAEMLAAFRSATNWSAYANKMQIGGKYADQ